MPADLERPSTPRVMLKDQKGLAEIRCMVIGDKASVIKTDLGIRTDVVSERNKACLRKTTKSVSFKYRLKCVFLRMHVSEDVKDQRRLATREKIRSSYLASKC